MAATLAEMISAIERDGSASETLFSTLYAELHRVARRELARSGGCSLGPTTVLHQAYMDMAGREGPSFPDRPRFMAYAARVMRGLIIDEMRSRHALKRGGGFELTSLDDDMCAAQDHGQDEMAELERIDEALDDLALAEPALAEIVDLKFFCGFSFLEIAAMHGVSERTVQRQWHKARIYLHHSLGSTPPS